MSEYRYVFLSMITEKVIAEIPLYGVYMDMELNNGGRFDGTFQLDQTGKNNQDLIDATIPGTTYVVVERNNFPIWAGPVWSRTYQSQSKSMQLFAQSFEVYPAHQIVLTEFVRTNIEQRNIFRDLWSTLQTSTQGRNININVPASFSTVISKSLTILASDYKYYREAMSSIADATDGFDWYITLAREGTFYNKVLKIGYPTVGAVTPITTFEYPGAITNYYSTESMSEAGTNIFVFGSGEGSSMPVFETIHQDLLNAGFPRWDKDVSRKDISSTSIFDTMAAQEGKKRKAPMQVTKISIKSDRDPVFGSWALGDVVNVYITDSRFPTGFNQTPRIVKWELHPQSSSNVEEANIIFQGDEA